MQHVPIRTTNHIVEISWCVTVHDQHGVLCHLLLLGDVQYSNAPSRAAWNEIVEKAPSRAAKALRKLDVRSVKQWQGVEALRGLSHHMIFDI